MAAPAVTATPVAAGRAPRRFAPSLVAGTAIIVLLVLGALLVDLVSPYTTTQISGDRLHGPSAAHWLGTDNLGRDLATRIGHAARAGLLISLVSTVVAMALGTALGIMSGYLRGVFDQVVMRGVDILLALPAILLALMVRVVAGPGIGPLLFALALIFAPTFARIMRAPALVLREREFVEAARLGGVRAPRIAAVHLLPNALTPMLVQFANTASLAVLLESSLSYLGQGVQPPDPSAGRMINEAQRFMTDAPMLVIVPAALIVAMTVGWNLVADGLTRQLSKREGDRA